MLKTIRASSLRALTWVDDDSRIARNVANILRIWQGEAAFARPMGVNPSLVGMPAPSARRELASQIRASIAEYEPDADVLDVRVLTGDDGGCIIEVDIDD